jgi:glyoxylase-like metal-dependent hydrolase (beta-lactamase superfamily II)/8-oxo-dGTP pyrophosphatase MutT (NUDIX family)
MTTKKAVSILLTRDPESAEVYLVERSPSLRFFGGYYAFPGGKVDEEGDTIKVVNADNLNREQVQSLLAAAREIFEETGVLLSHGPSSIPNDRLEVYREQLVGFETKFAAILNHEKHYIDATDFHPLCKIITPEFSPMRYETEFYWAKIPEGSNPRVLMGELVDGRFIIAEDALTKWRHGEMLIVPPVLMILRELAARSVSTFVPYVNEIAESYLRGHIHRVYFSPGIQLVPIKTRTLPPATHTNTYLVGESDIYVIDPAPSDPTEQARLWNYLDEQLTEGRDFKAILLTHHHSDHVGALRECSRRYGLPILAHELTVAQMPDIEFAGHLRHDDELDLGVSPDGQPNWRLKVYHTPGHAAGHLAFRESRYGAIIAGDLISTVSTIVISPPEGHMATYLESLRFLASVTNGMLYPGHGPAVRNGREVLHYYLQHRKDREQKLIDALGEKPVAASDLVQVVYDDVNPNLWPLAAQSLQAGLIKLIEDGKCLRVGDKFKAAEV